MSDPKYNTDELLQIVLQKPFASFQMPMMDGKIYKFYCGEKIPRGQKWSYRAPIIVQELGDNNSRHMFGLVLNTRKVYEATGQMGTMNSSDDRATYYTKCFGRKDSRNYESNYRRVLNALRELYKL